MPDIAGANGTWTYTHHPAPLRPDGSKSNDGITISFKPKASTNCKNIRLFQTVKMKAYNAAGDLVGSSLSEIFKTMPPQFRHLGANHIFIKEDGRFQEVFVDHIACEGDPYYNGDDAAHDIPSKGDSTTAPPTPTTMYDGPGSFFNGDLRPGITKIVVIFETCAICIDTGKILGCIKWSTEVTSTDKGTITVPTAEGQPSDETKKALKQFAARHTVWASSPDGKPHWFCPEDGKVKHELSEKAYRKILFNQETAMVPAAAPPEHGFRKLKLRQEYAGGGTFAPFNEVYATATSKPEVVALKFTWTGAQIKSMGGILLSTNNEIKGVHVEPFVFNEEVYANDFVHLSVVKMHPKPMKMFLSQLEGMEQDKQSLVRPVLFSLIANVGTDKAICATQDIDARLFSEAFLKVAIGMELENDELDAINYLRLNMFDDSPIKKL